MGDCWENAKYMVVEWHCNLPVYTTKPWQGDRWARVVYRNILMCIAPANWQEGIQYELEDSDYDTSPGDAGLLELTLSTTGLVTQIKLAGPKHTACMDLGSPVCPTEVKEQLFKVVGKLPMGLVTKVNTGLALLTFNAWLIWRVCI